MLQLPKRGNKRAPSAAGQKQAYARARFRMLAPLKWNGMISSMFRKKIFSRRSRFRFCLRIHWMQPRHVHVALESWPKLLGVNVTLVDRPYACSWSGANVESHAALYGRKRLVILCLRNCTPARDGALRPARAPL